MVWDYAETNPFAEASGSWNGSIDWVVRVLRHIVDSKLIKGTVEQADARIQLLANDMANAFATDPPYYDSYPYADLSDFFYPFLRRMMLFEGSMFQSAFTSPLTPKNQEIVLQPSRIVESVRKDQVFYQESMTQSLKVGRIETRPDGIGIIIFANKATEAWEVFLRSVCNAGWIVTSSWPVQTERESRTIDQARLQSSIHLVCRPREDPSGDLVNDAVGDWRDVLEELPQRIRAWLPRLREEGIVGADAIFACLGPALEIFSRYARVEKASGEQVSLREYLEQVWAAVAREALSMIFAGAETTGLEADARLTAMWLWTLNTAANGAEAGDADEEETGDEEAAKPAKLSGFVLEYDAARKIAQGLGAHLDKLPSVVEVKGDKARLLPVAERARALFGKEAGETAARRPPKAKPKQMSLFAALGEVEEATTPGVATAFRLGETALDRLHQAMLLFAAGRGEALKRFLVEEGVGRDQRLWRLAQSLSALYPSHTEEKRWVDGVLARKKGLGL